eukprot:3646305-Rhodomonas_salina.1
MRRRWLLYQHTDVSAGLDPRCRMSVPDLAYRARSWVQHSGPCTRFPCGVEWILRARGKDRWGGGSSTANSHARK